VGAVRINSTHSHADRGDDFYPTPRVAIDALIRIERDRIPGFIWEPACGDGAIAIPLLAAGYSVTASDLVCRGFGNGGCDYLQTPRPVCVEGIITNPPFKLAESFLRKAIAEVPYSAWLLRMNFVESVGRLQFFRETPPARIWVSSRRLPMMHREGWEGPIAPSNVCFAWFVWDNTATGTDLNWFDWRESDTPEDAVSDQLDLFQ
jgi:hypothetical protein